MNVRPISFEFEETRKLHRSSELPPRLLVAVRSIQDLEFAIRGGADILDFVLPEPLGIEPAAKRFDWLVMFAGLRAPTAGISLSLGELATEQECSKLRLPPQIRWVRYRMNGLRGDANWEQLWMQRRSECESRAGRRLKWLATVTLDEVVADAPRASEIIEAARATDCAGVWLDVNVRSTCSTEQGASPLVWSEVARRTRELQLPLFIGGHVELEDVDWLCDLEPMVIQMGTRYRGVDVSDVQRWTTALSEAVCV